MAIHVILSSLLFALSTRVTAVPIFGIGNTNSNAAVSILSTAQTDPFVRPARFSQIAYCSPQAVLSWNCGPSCAALPGIEPIAAGGDDALVPRYFIAHDPTAQSIVVAHQGTNSSDPVSVINDLEFNLEPLNTTLFPGASSSIQTHNGFALTFGRTADQILGNVTAALASKGVNKVEIHGHSLGAAIAVMDAVFLRQHLDPSVTITTTVFGLPRGGNQNWANFVDQNAPGLTHIHNRNDPVGTIPPRLLGFQHPSGEIHIQANSSSVNCPGQENQDSECLDGQNILDLSIPDHFGPYYANVSMSGSDCPL